MNTFSRLGLVLVPLVLMLWGCAPKVTMTVEQRDGGGNLITSFVKTSSAPLSGDQFRKTALSSLPITKASAVASHLFITLPFSRTSTPSTM